MHEAAPASRLITTLPNALSMLRIVLAVAFPVLPEDWRLGVVAAGALSDWLDGLIARRYGACSVTGGLIDAIADKVFVLSVLLTLTFDGPLEPWQTGLVLTRDLMVAGRAVHVVVRREWSAFRRMPARMLGKAATVAQFALLAAILLQPMVDLVEVTFAATVVLSLLAAGDFCAVGGFGVFLRQSAVESLQAFIDPDQHDRHSGRLGERHGDAQPHLRGFAPVDRDDDGSDGSHRDSPPIGANDTTGAADGVPHM